MEEAFKSALAVGTVSRVQLLASRSLSNRVATVHGCMHLRVGEAGGGDAEVVQHVRPPAHVLHRADALRARRVRQHVLACAQKKAPHARSENLCASLAALHVCRRAWLVGKACRNQLSQKVKRWNARWCHPWKNTYTHT